MLPSEILELKGWGRSTLIDNDGCRCALGAFLPEDWTVYNVFPDIDADTDEKASEEAYTLAMRRGRELYGERFQTFIERMRALRVLDNGGSTPWYPGPPEEEDMATIYFANDNQNRVKGEIIRILKECGL